VMAALALLRGCSSNEAGLLPVSGVVLLDGKPIANAAVMFHHQGGQTAYAITAADGSFALTTHDPGDGVLAGEHHVTVSLTVQEGGVQPNEKGLEDYTRPIVAERLVNVVPKIYNAPNTSPVTVTIAKNVSRVKIELSSSAR